MSSRSSNHTSDAHPVGELINELLKKFRLKNKFDESKLVGSWEHLVGKTLSKHTKKVFLRDHVLFVELDSPSLKNDLSLNKAKVLKLFQDEFGTDAVRDMIVM